MADFFFFTDIDLISIQNIDQAFGPVINNTHSGWISGKDRWRVTSVHSATGSPTAYAVCSGEVIVQQDASNSALVNIILKPFDQPAREGVDLPEIKYYIYRGILKSSLISGLNVVYPSQNSLSHKINIDKGADGISIFAPKYVLGIDRDSAPKFDDTDYLDNLFYIQSSSGVDTTGIFQKFPVDGGDSLGTFNASKFGFEIVLNRIFSNPPISEFRTTEHFIETDVISAHTGSFWEVQHRTKKEEINNYLDPAAFYGAFHKSRRLQRRESTDSVTANYEYTFSKVSENDVYAKILEGDIGTGFRNIFYNRNTVYLDIQNELGFSFNYMKNYGNTFRLSFDDNFNNVISAVHNRNYYDDFVIGTEWPIFRLKRVVGTGEGTPGFVPTSSENTLRFSMPEANWHGLMYLSHGFAIKSAEEEARVGKSKFFIMKQSLEEGFWDEAAIKTANITISSTKFPVATYCRLKYLKQLGKGKSAEPSNGTSMNPTIILDQLFPLKISNPFDSATNMNISIYEEDTYVSLNGYEGFGYEFVGKVGISRDLTNTTLFIIATEILKKKSSDVYNSIISISSESREDGGHFLNYVDSIERGSDLEKKVIIFNSDLVQITHFLPRSRRDERHLNEVFVSIVIENSKYDTLVTKASNAGINTSLPAYLFIGDGMKLDISDYNTKDDTNQDIFHATLHVRGYKDIGGSAIITETKSDASLSDPLIKIFGYPIN